MKWEAWVFRRMRGLLSPKLLKVRLKGSFSTIAPSVILVWADDELVSDIKEENVEEIVVIKVKVTEFKVVLSK